MDWRAEREQGFTHARRIVVKAGSAVLTDAAGLADASLRGIVAQLADLHDQGRAVVLVSSGAVAAGRAALGRGRVESHPLPATIPGRQAAAAIGQSRLMHAYDEAFGSLGIVTAQVLLTRGDFQARHRFLNMRNTFSVLLEHGVVPIVNENDTVAVQELKFGDNDTLASLLLNAVEADLFINLTSAPGVFTADPASDPKAGVMARIENVDALDLDALCGGKTSVGSGGMYSKLLGARRAARLGVPTLILPGREPDIIRRAMRGEEVGTWIVPHKKGVARRKFWLAYNGEAAGTIVVDDGAAEALSAKGSSLLPAGVRGIEGSFKSGSLVRIVTMRRETLGVGLTNYDAEELKRIMGRRLAEIASEAHRSYAEVIHRDNLLLDHS